MKRWNSPHMTELTVKLPPMSNEQIQTEIDAVRAEHRAHYVPSSMAGRGC